MNDIRSDSVQLLVLNFTKVSQKLVVFCSKFYRQALGIESARLVYVARAYPKAYVCTGLIDRIFG